MIFIVNESMMNGIVVMKNIINGIEANSFEEAKIKLQKQILKLGIKNYEFTNEKGNDTCIAWKINQDYPVIGTMDNKPLQIL